MLEGAFKNIYLLFTAVLAAVVAGGTVVVAFFYNINAIHILVSVGIWACIFLFMHKYAEKKTVVLCVAMSGVILRILYAVFCTQLPESDFKLYYDMASAFSSGNFNISDYARMFPHVIGFSSVLAGWFKLFGVSVVSARMLGVFFDIITCIFLYLSSYRMFGRKAAGFSVFLFSLSPSVVLYSGLVCTEKCSVMLISLFFAVITFIKKKTCIVVSVCSFIAVLANVIRPNGIILFVTLILNCIVILNGIKKKVVCIILCLLVYITSSTLSGMIINQRFGDVATNPTGWNLYVGFNTQSYGQWNEEDASVLDKVMTDKAADNAHKIFRDMTLARIKTNSVWGNTKLILSKFAVMWSNDIAVCSYLKNDNVYNTLYKKISCEAIISGFYILLCMCALYSGILIAKKRKTASIPVILVLLGTVALHLLSEVMGRYAYPGMICMFLLCSTIAEERNKIMKI